MRRAAKRDIAEQPIVDALEAVGAKVTRVSQGGVPDLLVSYKSVWYLLEVKSKNGKLTDEQHNFLEYHGSCQIHVVRDVTEALTAIGAMQ